ncbi:hypothetical protein ZTR_06680 [Talaromyces verruculosus]|nr:hypothetical protein ZTR_06680 [Talaromyces verruculosus]
MGRIKKAAGSKHEATISPYLSEFIKLATKTPLPQLPSHLKTLPRTWPFPRGDLYHWIPLLDRFDDILASVIERYGLNLGPQVTPFSRYVLHDAAAGQDDNVDEMLNGLGYGSEGDRELVEAILSFSQLLQEKCGNRSLYSSSDRLNDLLNTTSNALLITTLRLALLLAQRYHARQRNASATHFQQALLAAHYNIDLDKVQKLSSPFPRPTVFGKPPAAPTSPVVKAKEKPVQTRHDANDAVVLLREKDGWEEWGNIRAVYYPGVSEQERQPTETQSSEQSHHQHQAPSTPTPLRRSATMPTPRLSRMSSNEESPSVYGATPSSRLGESTRNSKLVEIPAIVVTESPLETILGAKLSEIPTESKYDFLHRARVAQSLVKSDVTREQILTIRILALTNLAYLYPEAIMQQRILQLDSDQPKRLQITYQLAELAHLGASGDLMTLRTTQTAALYALDALTKHKSRSADVCAALNVNVNHGILMFLTRKAITELSADQDDGEESDDWRDALLLLLRTLPGSSSRTPETLIAAGLIPMFVDVLNLRTEKARRVYPRVLEFLDTFVHAVRDALGTLANAKGFDAISDLIGFETKSAFDNVNQGIGIPTEYRTPSVDYDIPYFQQQSLRWLFRFVNHIMQHNGGGFDRLLRNLVDSPPLLTALRLVFENAKIFGSHVWSGAVSILSSFIHNEPTSYAVIAEAGLSKSLLEAITLRELKTPEADATVMTEVTEPATQPGAPLPAPSTAATISHRLSRTPDQQLARGIIPASEAMSCIPQAFGAICLNSAGLELFQSSGALESYFEIFESPVHVKCMDANLVRSLGTTFDELVRHHPALKKSVMSAVLVMVARVGLLCKKLAYKGAGAKLWTSDGQGNLTVIGGKHSLFTEIGESFEDTVKRDGQFSYPILREGTLPNGGSMDLGPILDSDLGTIPSAPSDADEWGLTAANYIYPVMRFLGAFFENQVNCTYFIETGGVEFILDFATLPSLTFDFQSRQANNELTQLVHMMAETKPHLVIPSIVKRTQDSVDCLADFYKEPKPEGFFTSLTKPDLGDAMDTESTEGDDGLAKERGTYYVKHLVATHVLTDILREIYTTPMYQTRPSQQTSAFSQVNLTEQYTNLVTSLGQLHAACVWDEILLQKNLPQRWIEATKVRGYDLGSDEANDALGLSIGDDGRNPSPNIEPPPPTSSTAPAAPEDRASETAPAASADEGAQSDDDRKPAFKNTQTLRYLLSSLPTTISGFFHLLGHGILGKRRPDTYSRQNASMVADAIAGVVLRQLQLEAPNKSSEVKDRFSYLIVILSAFTQLLFEAPVERSHSHCLTAILFAFKRQNGLSMMRNLSGLFLQEINTLAPQGGGVDDPNKSARLASAYGGLKIILTFFSEVTSAKESSQAQALLSTERERDRPDYFSPGQFLVDLRMEVLPMVRELWSSDFVDRASSSIVKCLVEILRSILDGEHENGAVLQKINGHQFYSEYPKKEFFLNQERLNTLVERGYNSELAHEALFRCNNVLATSDEYCHAQTWLRPPPRLQPESDLESTRRTTATTEEAPVAEAPSNLSVTDTNYALARIIREGPPRLVQGDSRSNNNMDHEAGSNAEFLTRALSRYFGDPEALLNESQTESSSRMHRRAPSESVGQSTELRRREITTIEDLDAERDKVRKNMIERCLDVLNVHHDVTFELADLIASATKKHRDPEGFRKEVGETLVQSLISLQIDDDVQPSGKKIAAYANLLALVLQDRSIYQATIEELKECFLTLLGFIKIPISDKAAEESSPWVGQVLLVIEKLLSDDAQPPQIQWNAPSTLDEPIDPGPAALKEPLLSTDEKVQLFESLLDVLPRVGKDESLALSVCRILVILTRARHIAVRMGEKRNLQRLFVMLKQLSSSSNDKLQGAFMLILRHIVEDDDTVRQIMRSEITASFESRSSRQTDTTAYVRQMYHLVLRSPELFVEVTNEILKIQRFEPSQKPQNLALKATKTETVPESEVVADKAVDTVEDKESTETKDKGKVVELKPPVVEHPDGVIHYLLSELLSYRDVDDKDSTSEAVEGSAANISEPQNESEMSVAETSPSSSIADLSAARDTKKQEKPAFKADDHPIYIYRCFLLQCLTELLSSYNRTKVEFINYSRKADPMATTPSKPRGGVLNYLLNTLVPTGTLEHDESVVFKKRSNTSSCAMRVLVALCTKTGEFGGNSRRRNVEDEEEEPELLFVRRFALEHALKAYKDAMSSTEPLDMKYSRLMCLADLFDKMLSGYTFASGDTTFPSSTRQLAKTMFEKHFISSLTASIADVDLNFPASKRVIKYILRPLNKLTQTAVILSETSSISTLGETEEYEISSATSVSDMEDDREETPDLFRHSTLGMLELNHEEDTSEEESEEDDEMYDDEYGDEMDYDEDLPEDDGEVLESEFGDLRQVDPHVDGSRFENLFRVIHEAAGAMDDFPTNSMGGDPQEDLVVDGMNEEEDEEEEDEVDELEEGMDDMDDDQLSYDEGIDDEDMEPWGWDGEEPPTSRHHHHHHHRHVRGTPAWTSFPSGFNRNGIIPIPPYRSQRSQMTSRNTDDGTNPLLIRTDRGPDGVGQIRGPGTEAFTDWVHGVDSTSTGRVISMDTPVSFMNAIMQAIEGQGGPGFGVITRPDGIHVHVDRRALLPGNQLQSIFELGRPQIPSSRSRDDPSQSISFALATTTARWQEEARILFSSNHLEKTQRVINSLLRVLVPPAIEEEKKRRAEEEAARRRREEERLEKERADRLAREEEEREQRRKEAEQAARRQEELARQAEHGATVEAEEVDEPMNDIDSAESLAEAAAEAQETGPSEPVQRVYTNIRGRQVEITGMEIDPEYLEALPEDLREEVIMQQLAEQRSQAVASGEEPTDISQEFLEALPPEIREEILQAEASARRRRERESARRQAAASGAPAHAEEMDPASFMATLDPSLRQSVLADQPDEILATLGPEFLTEARALPGRRLAQFGDVGRVEQRQRDEVHDHASKKPQRRQIVQILDKAGVATLLRLMFMPLQGNARHQLHDILHNVCENRQNRVETISLILSILQDGSLDAAAIERSFAHLSLRAKMPSVQKTPQSAKRNQAPPVSSGANNDVTPLLVVQQCLDTLSFLTQYNPHISWFFLTEHESASMLKLRALRKGKGKEAKDNRYPLNALLSLLDRDMIMESPNCMEQLAHLLSTVTQPLTILLRREKEKQEDASKGKEPQRPDDTENDSGHAATETTEVHDTDMPEATDAVDTNPSANEEKSKKRTIEPPVIPDHNLQLVVGILAARECNGKTFRETLSTINNLSAIPGAKDVIGKELISQAQALSEAILINLDELLPHIEQASSGTDVQGLALSKFSPASSDQAKLLRILTALDYLFDPNRLDKVKGAEPESAPKEDVLRTLYENSTFGPLWSKLSACLTIIRQKENMLNVATTLLPLIEALMVVCKNTSLKDAPISRLNREHSVATPTSETGPGMENLFFNFTEEHRKILNELVRQNPRLMSGTFSLLVKNPKVLEFDNKRNYFTRRIHSRGAEVRQPHPPLQLSVRRDQVFLDSFKSLYFKTAEEVKYGKLNIRFHGEEGVDAGGVTREWFQVLARGMFNPNYALFIPVASDRTTFHPNRLSGVNTEHLMFFKFIGRIIGKALYEGRVLDCHFSRAVYKSILGKSVSIKDMETLDLDYYKSLLWMLENDITDIITETFAIETDDFGETQVIDLIPNGRNIPVTQENKEEYVQRVVEYKLAGSVKEQLENFLKGFHDIIPPDLISIFNEQELELLISGLPEIDVDDWKNNTEYHNYSASSQQIQWFWRAVRSFDKEERAKLLQFVTGTSKVPLNGFKELEGMNGFSRFNIHRDYGNKERLPSSHTCFNQLDLPEYESYEDLRSRLYKAMTAGGDYFGFA